ncbi:unnamed protein product [Phytophthora fragariaefolia]|uniref:Unnamed protein product n=1 Tax=Phytophthora fragariaefolia TaxID=1490495 RepID=A0A9W7D129_9STRA|nr:unnamed protein product [Phytophthora fragariaefolia]
MSGEDLGHWIDEIVKFNFLNPARKTLLQLWKGYGKVEDVYTGNEGPIKSTKYSRFAIVAWPITHHLLHVVIHMPAEFAVEELLSLRPVNAADLRNFLRAISARHGWGPANHPFTMETSVRFTRSFFELLVDAGDVDLVKLFLTKYCPRLGNSYGNETAVPAIIKIANAFVWSEIGESLLDILDNGFHLDGENRGHSNFELLLHVADSVNSAEAQQALLKMALEKELNLRTVKGVGIFWKRIIIPGDAQTFKEMRDKILKVKPSELGPFVEVFTKNIDDHDTTVKLGVLEVIAAKRMDWLGGEINRFDEVDKTFSWKMPFAKYPGYPTIERFLHSPEESMTTVGLVKFSDLRSAKKFAREWTRSPYEASFRMTAGENKEPFLTITKTRKWHNDAQEELMQYREELIQLSERFHGAQKRARSRAE